MSENPTTPAEMVQVSVRDHPMRPLDRYRIWGYQLKILKKGKPLPFHLASSITSFSVAASIASSRMFSTPAEGWGELTYCISVGVFGMLGIVLLLGFLLKKKEVDREYNEIVNIEPEDGITPTNPALIEGTQESKAKNSIGNGGTDSARQVESVNGDTR